MKRLSPPTLPTILLLCLGLFALGCPQGGDTVDPAPPDTDTIHDVGGDADIPRVDIDGGEVAEIVLDVFEVDTDVMDPCACVQGVTCGTPAGCAVDCGLCGPGDFCLENLCVPEGSVGTPCEDAGDCDEGAPCLDTDPPVCAKVCADDGDCPKHMECVEQPGNPDPVFLCIPICDDPAECADGGCGFISDGCGTFVPCGDCEGDNEYCSAENLCVCEFEACDETCCNEGESCVDGACIVECEPACEPCFVCTAGACLPVTCPVGEHCENDVCVKGGVACDPCNSADDCAPDLTCPDGFCRSETDATCDDCDDDGDGNLNDDYVPIDDCGMGVCQDSATASVCLAGIETPCQPGEPLADEDTTCDMVDDDCDGDADEDYAPDATCGVGACQTNNTPSTCVDGVETDCVIGEPVGEVDAICDGEDDDCDGDVDEDYVPDATCGVGWCFTNNTASSCADGVETPCEPGPPASADTSCNGVDDDCDSDIDDDYIVNASCGVGICKLGNTPSSCEQGFEVPCAPGDPIGETDGICDGLDDDCDGQADEDFVPDASCGVGYCQMENTPSSCVAGVMTPCVPGEKLGDVDDQCDYIDDDCDGEIDEDADPPCATGAPVDGATVSFFATLGLASGIVADNGDGTYASTVVDLTNPNKSGAVSATCNDNTSDAIAFSVTSGDVAAVELSVSRAVACADDASVRACARVIDDLGAPAANDVGVQFTLDIGGEELSQPGQSQGDGIFCAWLTTPGAVFGAGAAGTVTAVAAGISSDPVVLNAAPTPAALALEVGEVGIRLPLCTRLAATGFDVPVIVNTGDAELGSYNISCSFDGNILSVQSVSKGAAAAMGDPVSSINTGSVSFTAINTLVDGTAKGPSVEVAVISFEMAAVAGDGDSTVMTCEVNDLFNTNLVSIASNATVQVHDGDGQGQNGFVDAASLVVSGLFAVLTDNALVDFAKVSGDPAVALVKVMGLKNDGSLSDIASAPGTVCAAADAGVAVSAGCAVTATGPGATTVTATAGGHASETPLWVLGPELPAEMTLTDSNLRYIPHIDRLQDARVRVVATFTDGDLFAFDLDVTADAGFASLVPAVAQVDESGLVSGLGNGDAMIVAIGALGDELGSAALTVEGSEDVAVTAIKVVVPATVQVTGVEPMAIPDDVGETAVEATVTNLFDTDGQQVQASVLLILADDAETNGGSRVDITGWKDSEAGGATSFGASNDGVISVDDDGMVTAVGSGEATVDVDFENSSTGYTAQGTGEVEVQLPPPTSVDLTVADPRLALDDADSAHTILGLPTARQLGVLVHFIDGSSKDFTALPQTLYMVTGNLVAVTNFADCVGVPGCTPGSISSTGQGIGVATVTVSFPGTYLQVVTANLEIEVVSHDELILKSVEVFTPQGEEPVADQVLSWVECTTTRQQSRLIVEEIFSDGSVVDLSGHAGTSYGVYAVGTLVPDATVISVDAATDRATAVGLGTVDVRAMNGDHSSGPLAIQVDNAHLDVTGLQMTYAPGATFHGVRDTGTGQLDVVGTFADDTRTLLTGGDAIAGLLTFTSDAPAAAMVDAGGLMTAKGNGPVAMTVDVNASADCELPYAVTPGLALKVNLLPAAGDVDMGFASGLAFPDQAADAVFEIPVRVNTGGKNLGGVDLEIDYDPAVITPLDAVVGSSLPGAIFTANLTLQPGKIYLNASPALGSPVSGGGVEVAVITFQALKGDGPLITPIGGTVIGIVDTGGSVIGTDTPRPIVAGAGQFDPPPGGIWGDANDDEKFSIADVLFVQQIIVEPPLVIPNPTQVVQSDLFPDGIVASNDAFYASRNLARLVHFVEVVVTPTGFPGQSEIKVIVTDRDQLPVDENLDVRVELSTTANIDTIIFTNGKVVTESGAVTLLDATGSGQYITTVSGLMQEEPNGGKVGIVVILDLLGPDGEVLETTAFIQTPFLDPAADFVPIAYVEEICEGSCDGLDCGEDDGCGKPCIGGCPFDNEICINAQCVCGGISCAGKACGEDDGCGAPCVVPCPDPDETCSETGCACDTDLCDGDCCPADFECAEYPPGSGSFHCTDCAPDCVDQPCGQPDGCGWFCDGGCPEINQICNDEFVCVCGGEYCVDQCCPVDNVCLNDACCEVQTCQTEGWECGAHFVGCATFVNCGDCGLHGICDTASQCDCEYEKCGGTCCGPEDTCVNGQCVEICIPDCAGKLCGESDGCDEGGVCEGPCALSNQECVDGGGGAWACECVFEECAGVCCDAGLECDCFTGECAAPCTPDCDGQLCGQPDGCCGACQGPCPLSNQYCANGSCLCEGNGGFPCGGVCCAFGDKCEASQCVPDYVQDCFGKECGADDGFGGICLTGACPEANQACADGICVCEDAYCGGVCCDAGEVCDGDLCCEPFTCADFGAEECGAIYDGCGATLNCGACGDDEQCADDYTCECAFHDAPCGDICCGEHEYCDDADICQVECPVACAGAACGDPDGCGGQCEGTCAGANELCVLLATIPSSVWSCDCLGTSCLGKACGEDDGCGGICDGPCAGEHEVCAAGGCECAGNDGATCGVDAVCCPDGWICNGDGECEFDCPEKDCTGKACGEDNNCGEPCDGPCPGLNEACNDTFICECAGDFCDGACCPVNNVCYLDACCEVDTCESLGYDCGAHYIGCGTFTDCGSCGDDAICNTAFECECENVQCGDECCAPGLICDPATTTCKPPCSPSCLGIPCGDTNECGEECAGPCAQNEQCNQVGPGDYECGCALVECAGACCGQGEVCLGGLCLACDPLVNCEGAMCGDDDLCGGICYGDCPGFNEYCEPNSGDCLCANGELPCEGECCPWSFFCNVEQGICEWDCDPVANCVGKACGVPDQCGGYCDGPCPGNLVCVNNQNCICPENTCGDECCADDQLCDDGACCDPVTCAAYGAIECGLVDDGCGNLLDCGVCGDGFECNAELQCECADVPCGDACCNAGETCLGGACCAPDCEGKACGEPDLCGFLCNGPCDGAGEICVDGQCLCGGASCVGKDCGDDDGCGGVCTAGACGGENEICANGTCLCANQEEECGGVCCPEFFFCLDGDCVDCFPNCAGAACGDPDGCGGLCDGTCVGDDMVCTDQYFCDCAGAWCEDLCCPAHNICVDGACCALDSCDTVLPFGAECGTHDLGCDTLTSCGDCADAGENMFCNTSDWTCKCEFAECEGECCDAGKVCWPDNGCVDCIPDCVGADCGADDGCGGICTEGSCSDDLAVCDGGVCECVDKSCNGVCCPMDWSCKNGECQDVCVPICVNKLCGDDDGCGNACPGDCLGAGEVCVGGACYCEFATCVDDCCAAGEACMGGNCVPCTPQSCGEVGAACGFVADGCGSTQFCGSCGADEACEDGVCLCAHDTCLGFCCGAGEICDGVQCVTCPTDCTDKACGDDDGCGGLCDGDCPLDSNTVCIAGVCTCENILCAGACCGDGEWCIGGECVFCEADCDGKLCGEDNGCGVPCDGACPAEEICIGGACECNFVECGDTCCASGELCVDGACACEYTICGGTCCDDGDTCLGGDCCTPECENKLCGAANGCAGPCMGPCFGANQVCDLGTCVCEFDTCGDACCASDELCLAGECVPCIGDCVGKNCGVDDGCGNACDGPCPLANQACDSDVGACYCEFASCGTACCAQGQACSGGKCVDCVADCDGKSCGDDSGCGYPCDGPCAGPFEICNFGACGCTETKCLGACCAPGEDCVNGACCMTDCEGKVCGEADGCGGTCQGACTGEYTVCAGGQCLCEHIECFGECCQEGSTCANDTCCFPQTCEDLGAECGLPGNGCGNVQYCGSCGDDQYCSADYTCDCVYDSCGDTCCGYGEECVAGVCEVICDADCSEAACGGDDGCGGICLQGSCADGWSQCYNGVCACEHISCGETCCGPDQVCQAGACCDPVTCADVGAECGLIDNGCGGQTSCGACDSTQWCDELNICYCTHEVCGDTCCGEAEVCEGGACCAPATCDDLGATCGAPGDGCGTDLECGECVDNYVCGPAFTCDCPGAICLDVCCGVGVEACDGPEGSCGGPTPQCDGKLCGDDNEVGGVCDGPCEDPNETCEFGVCECAYEACGDVCCPETDTCEAGECVLCEPDCVDQGCGADNGCNGLCDGLCASPWEACVAGVCECLHAECEGVCCGPDEDCVDGGCIEICVPACDGEPCGAPDECGGTCSKGFCPMQNAVCVNDVCACEGIPCGGGCCAGNEACVDGVCECIPSCLAKLCGDDDGCGGTCDEGACPVFEVCNSGICECEFVTCADACCPEDEGCVDGVCECIPDCSQAVCGGGDGCGGLCEGTCLVSNEICVDFECICPGVTCDDACCEDGLACFEGACCEPAVCEDFPLVECGVVEEVCGGPLFCGACASNQWCDNGACACLYDDCGGVCCGENNPCIDGACCEPVTCDALDVECALQPDGCGDWVDCGECPQDEFCSPTFQCECEHLACGAACCAAGEECNNGVCGDCQPICAGKFCGDDDGCGDPCQTGICGTDQFCQAGVCECLFTECGTECCADAELCIGGQCGCPDGGELCGDVCCDVGEFCGQDDTCACLAVCPPTALCGDDDGCGGLCPGPCENEGMICSWQTGIGCECPFDACGDICCTPDQVCEGGVCEDCVPSCGGKACGDDSGCGYACNGPCGGANEFCLNGSCDCQYEECDGACCGQYDNCENGECVPECVPINCTQELCGTPDGCGGLCDGTCPNAGDVCQEGSCICIPDCVDADCADADGCGGLCPAPCPDPVLQECLLISGVGCACRYDDCDGTCCADDETCNPQTNQCTTCVADCEGKNCGDDSGCGYLCGGPCPDPSAICEGGACACPFESCAGSCCGPDEECVAGECTFVCTPNCSTGVCGVGDGCGGLCDGTCTDPGETCLDGACVPCAEDCLGKSCGDDSGCGTLCNGPCPGDDEVCVDGACDCEFEACGDLCCPQYHECDAGECVEVCAIDCDGAECGQLDSCGGFCDGSCPGQNDSCIQGECVCIPDCLGQACAEDDGCGGLCFAVCPDPLQDCDIQSGDGCVCSFDECDGVCCAANEQCDTDTNECVDCLPDCVGKACGDDSGCGFGCIGDCPGDFEFCQAGVCYCENLGCGDACCDVGETCADGACCAADCVGKDCGDPDGCGELCDGACPGATEQCISGVCIDTCVPDCAGAACGDDNGCSGVCDGPCAGSNETCVDGACECEFLGCFGACCGEGQACNGGVCCTPECDGAICGAVDGCGGVCDGTCADDSLVCEAGECVCAGVTCDGECCEVGNICVEGICTCVPDCAPDAVCGDPDGCGFGCPGTCSSPYETCEGGSCVCNPDCSINLCGDPDGCGGTCLDEGICGDNESCVDGNCVCNMELCGGACCGEGTTCTPLGCVSTCEPSCLPGVDLCGDDNGCGGPCVGACADPDRFCMANSGLGCECPFAECGGVCCAEGEACDTQLQQCLPCTPNCAGKACGDDNGCGYECDVACGANQYCIPYGGVGCQCLYSPCDGGNTCCGENESCDLPSGQCEACTPDCAGKACGADSGCGYECDGPCSGNNEVCTAGICQCEFLPCDDACCAQGETCENGTCQ